MFTHLTFVATERSRFALLSSLSFSQGYFARNALVTSMIAFSRLLSQIVNVEVDMNWDRVCHHMLWSMCESVQGLHSDSGA
jgi:hypothetical protein